MVAEVPKPYLLKRSLDFLASAVLLIVFGPLLLLLALAVLVKEGRPVFFLQTRVGRDRRRFRILKFRTMTVATDGGDVSETLPLDEVRKLRAGFRTTTANDARITPIGAFLRRTSLDELPQLWNVLVGDMSLIGPRPMTPVQRADFEPQDWELRHAVNPGITGLAQVCGRSALTQEALTAYDTEYVKHCTFGMDARIAFLTVKTVFRRSGTN